MSSISARSAAVCFVLLCACIQVSFGQGPGYHMELSDGTSGRAILINDSAKAIEAFHFTGHCGKLGTEASSDVLDAPGNMIGTRGLDAAPVTQNFVLEPGGRMITVGTLLPQSSGCVWDAKFDAVLYAGGSSEGDEAVVQGLKASRESIIAAVKFWGEKFNQDGAEPPNPDELLALAKKLRDADYLQAFGSNCRVTTAPECTRQKGKFQVDNFIAFTLDWDLKTHAQERAGQATAKSLRGWQKKIDEISLLQN